METKEFTILPLSHLSLADLYALNKSTIECALPSKSDLGPVANAILLRLVDDNHVMGEQMNKATRNELTTQIDEMDVDRDNRFLEIKRNVTIQLRSSNPEKKAAATGLKIFFDPYWEANKKPMNTQTGLLSDLFDKYKASETLKAQAAVLGISELMNELETVNEAFNSLYQSRNQQDSAEGPSASSLRAAAMKSYNQFCISVEQAFNYLPSEILTGLFNQLDTLRKAYARLNSNTSKAPVVASVAQ